MKLEQMVNKYIVTTAQYGATPNKTFLAGLNKYCKINNAELLIIPTRGKTVEDERLHPDLQHYQIVDNEFKINKNIKVLNYDIRPNQVEPTTGLLRMAQGDCTTILPSPKQRMKVVPNSNINLPKVLMTTGAVTQPYYASKGRINNTARQDHKYGAIVVEKVNGSAYHYRQIDALKNGKFCELGMLYNGKAKPKKANTKAIVLGDLHGVALNSHAHKANMEQIKFLKPDYIVVHDLFDGASINHWLEHKEYGKLYAHQHFGLSLKKELNDTRKLLNLYANLVPNSQVVVVKSNHDERIDRWLDESRYTREPQNNIIGHRLFLNKYDGLDPLEEGLYLTGDVASNVRFLSRDEDFKLKGFQLGNHGDLGSNGARGSMRTKEYANGKSITGHTHSPEILRDTYVVGTSTGLKEYYTKGFSSWMNTNAVLYDIGKVQLINSVKSKWRK